MRHDSSPAASAARKNRGFTIMEMLCVLVLLIAFMFVSAPVMREILVTMRRTNAYENRTGAWRSANRELSHDIWSADGVSVISPRQLQCHFLHHVILWRIMPKGELQRTVSTRYSINEKNSNTTQWPDAARGLSFKATAGGVVVARNYPHQMGIRLLSNRWLRTTSILEKKP